MAYQNYQEAPPISLRGLFAFPGCDFNWLKTARNLVRYAGSDASYRDVEKYLKGAKLL